MRAFIIAVALGVVVFKGLFTGFVVYILSETVNYILFDKAVKPGQDK
jgi:hypothetical protein